MTNSLLNQIKDKFTQFVNKPTSHNLKKWAVEEDFLMDYNNKVNNEFMDKYKDINAIQMVLYKQVNNLNEFQTNLNLTKPLINQPYAKKLVQYINAQCDNAKQYKIDRLWANQSNPIIKSVLKQFEGLYENEPINFFKSQIIPKLEQELDKLVNKPPFKNSPAILKYHNRIQAIQKLTDTKLSLKLIQTGYEQTLKEVANNDFDNNDSTYMWNQQLQKTLKQTPDLKTKLFLISMNSQITGITRWLRLPIIDEKSIFKENIRLIDQLKAEFQNQADIDIINQVTKRFYKNYDRYQNRAQQCESNHDFFHLELNTDDLNFYHDANQALEIEIKDYLVKHPFN